MTITLTKNEIATIQAILKVETKELKVLIELTNVCNKSELRNEIVTIEKILKKLEEKYNE